MFSGNPARIYASALLLYYYCSTTMLHYSVVCVLFDIPDEARSKAQY